MERKAEKARRVAPEPDARPAQTNLVHVLKTIFFYNAFKKLYRETKRKLLGDGARVLPATRSQAI